MNERCFWVCAKGCGAGGWLPDPADAAAVKAEHEATCAGRRFRMEFAMNDICEKFGHAVVIRSDGRGGQERYCNRCSTVLGPA
jgi:hypothetical protein